MPIPSLEACVITYKSDLLLLLIHGANAKNIEKKEERQMSSS
jgi:hypothetical protein